MSGERQLSNLDFCFVKGICTAVKRPGQCQCVYAAYTFTTIENATRSFTMPASFDFIANGAKRGSQVSKKRTAKKEWRDIKENDAKEKKGRESFFGQPAMWPRPWASCALLFVINARSIPNILRMQRGAARQNANKAAGSNIIKSKWQQHQSWRRQRKLQQSSTTRTHRQPREIEVCVCQGQKNQLNYGISMGPQLASVSATRSWIANWCQ